MHLVTHLAIKTEVLEDHVDPPGFGEDGAVDQRETEHKDENRTLQNIKKTFKNFY